MAANIAHGLNLSKSSGAIGCMRISRTSNLFVKKRGNVRGEKGGWVPDHRGCKSLSNARDETCARMLLGTVRCGLVRW